MDINPNRSNRIMKAERAHRRHAALTHNPSSIEPGQTLQVRFPNLGEHDVIAPGSFFISFALNLKGKKDEVGSIIPNIAAAENSSREVVRQSVQNSDSKFLDDIGPYYQASLADKLEIKLIINDKKAVILGSTPTLAAVTDADYDYSVTGIRTELDQITSPSLASSMRSVYQGLALPESSRLD